MQLVNEYLFKVDDGEPNSENFNDALENFTSTYPSENPVTKEKA